MITENLSTLKIHKLTQAQYDRELAAGNLDENALYLTPDKAVDLTGYVTEEYVQQGYQPKGDYLTEAPVMSVNGKTGAVVLSAKDIGAEVAGTSSDLLDNHEVSEFAHVDIRNSINELEKSLDNKQPIGNYLTSIPSEYVTEIELEEELTKRGYITSYNETDPTVPSWAKASTKPTYTASEVGADAKGTASSLVSDHNIATNAHDDIRQQIGQLASDKADTEYVDDAITELRTQGMQQVPLFANSVEECTDTTKVYVLPDGFIYAYLPSTESSYTNLAGTITYDRRLSSSGKASSSALAGAAYTGFIPVKKGQIVRIKNFNIYTDFSSSAFPYVCFYTGASESNVVSSTTYFKPSTLAGQFSNVVNSVNGDVVTWTAFTGNNYSADQHPLADSITHIRFSGSYFADREIIVTVDEPITEGGSGGFAWQSTGHAFVPADYEAEITSLRNSKADKTAIPTKLPNPNALTIDGVKYDGTSAVSIETQSGGNILYGKKWIACGDSFTANGYNTSDGFDESVYVYQDGRFAGKNIVYPYIIGLRNNMDIVNLATGGQTMAASSNSFMTRYTAIDGDADYITIMLGINDKLQSIPVGTLEDTSTSTFCGAFNIAMEHILENHPFAHIGIMVSNGTNEEIMEATRGIAERWGVPYLDFGSPQVPLMNRYTGRNVCAKAQEIREKNFCVSSTGTSVTNGHPNTAAHEYESTFIEAWLRTL